MNKGYFYKFLTCVGKGVEKKHLNYDESIIEHNIPQELIINLDDIKIKYLTTESYIYRYIYAYVDKNEYENIISNKLIFPTFYNTEYGSNYIGAIIVRCKIGDIITYIYEKNDEIILKPVRCFDTKKYCKTCGELPNRSIKVFLTKEEFETDQAKKKENNDARRKKDRELTKDLTRQAPVFSFTTPKFKVIEVAKETAYLPGVKVGDIVYGEIPVIKGTDDRKWGSMKGIGTRTNWISIYINGSKVNTISPVTFPSLFFNNIVVEEVK